ncbi:MAG: hypothetical protein COA71_08590 [SAR86 cluster bacterium]|uniref:DUF4238 domain-containing protein n=1 Tax=SAR86 cluster bacterium TaxID=2030880 RepID=A0A2A5CC24_9GAMM|nr:MAG: hypothetical protein COA71_08590 [SAR86 cluster bacterium]
MGDKVNSAARNNHYVPQWYQRGFLSSSSNNLHYLDLCPDTKTLPNGRVITMNDRKSLPTSQCFYEEDLYSTFFGQYINDEIENKLFGELDDTGSRAIRAFINEDMSDWHNHFTNFFMYVDAQKIRTPKGLNWIRDHYLELDQNRLMMEMQAIRTIHCTTWTEGVREIVSAKNSQIKFIISDHPVTIYNVACPPESDLCSYPNDPAITLKGSQTIFPLDMDHCLILTNYEYAKNPKTEDPLEKRTNARNFRNSLVRTDTFIRTRLLNEVEVQSINLIIKARARRYIASSQKEWLYPEKHLQLNWSEIGQVLLPPEEELWHYGGETYVGYEDGSSSYHDAFGRTTPENTYLNKPKRKGKIGANDSCICGSGKKWKKCCRDKTDAERPASNVRSIRERNLAFCRGIEKILGLTDYKTWEDVRREFNVEHVKQIHEHFSFLWPADTDLISLLPKPDNTHRAVYTGIIDPRTITEFAVSSTLYFDEILIQNPFMNPKGVKPDDSPTESPHQFLQQTLKNVVLILTLEPYIATGYINFIPDPLFFDEHLRSEMMNMAKERTKGMKIEDKDKVIMEWLHNDDFKRAHNMLPRSSQRALYKEAMPELSDVKIEELLTYTENEKKRDPLTLLQDDIFSPEDGRQLIIMSLSPNFEMSLYIAQLTGAFIITDNQIRWKELMGAQHTEYGMVTYDWSELTTCIGQFNYILNNHSDVVFQQRQAGKLGEIRKVFRDIYSVIQSQTSSEIIDAAKERLIQQLSKAYEKSTAELKVGDNDDYFGTFTCVIPKGGIADNNIQRLLLSSGSENYLNNVPMIIFMEHIHSDVKNTKSK